MSEEKVSSTLNLKVLTPDGSVLEGDVYEVTLPGSEGEMGVFPQHAALMTGVLPGKLTYRAAEGSDSAALGKGVAEILNNEVRVLVSQAALREEIDVNALESARKKLLLEIDKETHSDKVAELEEQLLFTDIQLKVGGARE